MLAVILLGTAIYLHGIEQTLPYHLDPDEPGIYHFAMHLLTTGHLYNEYPPLRVIELALEFALLDFVTPGDVPQPTHFVVGRYFTVLYGVLLLAVTYQTGRQLHNRATGLAAVLFLMAQPDAVHLTKIFKTDNFAWLFGMMTLLLTFRVVRKGHRWLMLPAFLAGMAATGAKYTMLPILIVPSVVLITYVPQKPLTRVVAAVLAAVGLGIGIALVIHPPTSLANFLMSFHARQFYERESLIEFISLVPAWPRLLTQLGQINFWGVLAGLPIAVLVWPRIRLTRRQWLLLGTMLVMMVVTYVTLGFFRTNRAQDRYVIVLGFALLWGVTLAIFSQRREGVALLLALIFTAPWLRDAWEYGTSLRRPDTRALTAEWFIANVPEGTGIAVEKDFVEFNRSYGGFPSDRVFFVQEIDSVYERSLEEFARAGVEYLIADYRNIYRGGFFEPGRDNSAFLAQVETVLDLSDPWDRDWQGPSRYIFRIPPVQQFPMHVFLDDAIVFKGYDLASDTVMPGETLDLVLYWRGLRETDANYIVYAHVLTMDGATLVAQHDGPPGDALHRTYDWTPGYFDWDEWPIDIPVDAPPGEYILRIGMYDSLSLERLPAYDEAGTVLGDGVLLTTITIEAGE